MKGYLFAALSVLLVTLAQLAMKGGMAQLPLRGELLQVLLHPAPWWWPLLLVLLGIVAYACSMASWLMALNTIPLNRAYPLLSLSYALVYIAAVLLPWYNEPVSARRIIGVICIIVGIWWMNRKRSMS
ncbi:MAG: 4-amino-4-deoxy-L-arabinose-phosphoundecaprenol flippase subunit ArnF [Enterobacteriaceae bacterium]